MMNLYEVARFLEAHDNYDILTHAYPDGDTLGSGFALCLALRQIGKKARVITTGVPSKFTYLQKNIEEEDFTTETVVSVDVAADSFSVQIWANISARLICALTTTVQTHLPLRKSLLTNMRRQTAKFSTSCSSECTSTYKGHCRLPLHRHFNRHRLFQIHKHNRRNHACCRKSYGLWL